MEAGVEAGKVAEAVQLVPEVAAETAATVMDAGGSSEPAITHQILVIKCNRPECKDCKNFHQCDRFRLETYGSLKVSARERPCIIHHTRIYVAY